MPETYVDAFAAGETWDLPESGGLQVLESRVREALPDVALSVREGDLYSIARPERDALLDAMGEGADFPFVLLDGVVVHAGDFDPQPVIEALSR